MNDKTIHGLISPDSRRLPRRPDLHSPASAMLSDSTHWRRRLMAFVTTMRCWRDMKSELMLAS